MKMDAETLAIICENQEMIVGKNGCVKSAANGGKKHIWQIICQSIKCD